MLGEQGISSLSGVPAVSSPTWPAMRLWSEVLQESGRRQRRLMREEYWLGYLWQPSDWAAKRAKARLEQAGLLQAAAAAEGVVGLILQRVGRDGPAKHQ